MNTKLLLVVLIGLSGIAQAGDLYKWTDDKGVIHYSDTPPPSTVNSSRVHVQPGVTSDVEPSANTDASKPKDAPKASSTGSTPAPPPTLPTTPEDRAKLCEQARGNLSLLESKYQVADASGKALDDKTRQEMTAQAKQAVSDCNNR